MEVLTASEIDLKDPDIVTRYFAIINSSPNWPDDEKRRVIAAKETGRLINEDFTAKNPSPLAKLEARVAKLEAILKEVSSE